jgi:hypothetical protein
MTRDIEHYYTDGTEPTILRQPRIPLGCDQQGRYPQAAESATEIGQEDQPEHDMLQIFLDDVGKAALCMVGLAAILGIAYLAVVHR